MVKTKKFISILIFILLFFSCTLRYNTAIIKVYNSSSVNLIYKALLIDEQSENEPGKMIKKVISQNKEKLYKSETDSFDITWASFQQEVFVNILWGTSNVYDSSTGFFIVKDKDIITIILDSTTDWHFKE